MHKKDFKSVMDSEEEKCMGIGGIKSGTRSAELDQKDLILLWSSDDKRRLSVERDHAGHCTRSEKSKGDQGRDGLTTWKNGLKTTTTEGDREQKELE